MKGYTVKRNPVCENTVGEPALDPVNLMNMKEFTLGRNPM
jgi:hypothetical protein